MLKPISSGLNRREVEVLKQMRKQPTVFSVYCFDAEEGDRAVINGKVVDLYVSNGRNKRDSGELSYRDARKPHPSAKPVKKDGVWYWQWDRKESTDGC